MCIIQVLYILYIHEEYGYILCFSEEICAK